MPACISGKVADWTEGGVSDGGGANKGTGVCADLVRALERVRSRFVVVVATESKRLTTNRLRHYLEIEDATRRWVKELRHFQQAGEFVDPEWTEALRAVRSLLASPAGGSLSEHAQALSCGLREVMDRYQRRNSGYLPAPFSGRRDEP
jgi:hypothetical protein